MLVLDLELQTADLDESSFGGMMDVSGIHGCILTSASKLCALPLLSWILRIASSLIPGTGEDACHVAEVFPCQSEQIIVISFSSRKPLEVLEQGNNLIIAALYGG